MESALTDLANKIVDKKRVETDVAALQVAVTLVLLSLLLRWAIDHSASYPTHCSTKRIRNVLSNLKATRLEQEANVKFLKKQIQTFNETEAQKAQEIVHIENLLAGQRRKIEVLKTQSRDKLVNLQIRYDQLQSSVLQKKAQLQWLHERSQKSTQVLLDEQSRLQQAHTTADKTLERLQKGITQSKVIENARLKMLRDKAVLLRSLITSQTPAKLEGKLAQDIKAILQQIPGSQTPSSRTLHK